MNMKIPLLRLLLDFAIEIGQPPAMKANASCGRESLLSVPFKPSAARRP